MIMYAVQGRSWVAMGGPIGAEEEYAELAWTFHSLADRHGGWTVFYEVGENDLSVLIELGLTVLKIGEEARLPLAEFSLEGKAHKDRRHVRNKLEREGCAFEVVEATPDPLDFGDVCHFSEPGTDRFAGLLAEFIIEQTH